MLFYSGYIDNLFGPDLETIYSLYIFLVDQLKWFISRKH